MTVPQMYITFNSAESTQHTSKFEHQNSCGLLIHVIPER